MATLAEGSKGSTITQLLLTLTFPALAQPEPGDPLPERLRPDQLEGGPQGLPGRGGGARLGGRLGERRRSRQRHRETEEEAAQGRGHFSARFRKGASELSPGEDGEGGNLLYRLLIPPLVNQRK